MEQYKGDPWEQYMTIERAIEYLEDIASFEYKETYEAHYKDAICAARIALEALQKNGQKNNALTLEELRQMNGDPVWVVDNNGEAPFWGIVHASKDGWFHVVGSSGKVRTSSKYNTEKGFSWIAYRNKKEE